MNEHGQLKEETLHLIREVEDNPSLNQRLLSQRLNISLGKTNYLLKELIKKGIIKVVTFSTDPGKARKLRYVLTQEQTIKISTVSAYWLVDGKGRWIDNVFIERFWRTLKYDEVYLHAYENGRQARQQIGEFITLYNTGIPHSALGQRTPDSVYYKKSENQNAA